MYKILFISLLSLLSSFEVQDVLPYYNLDLDLTFKGNADKSVKLTKASQFNMFYSENHLSFSIKYEYILGWGVSYYGSINARVN